MKTILIILLVVFGILGFCMRNFIDMTQNWETGYGPDSRKATRQAFIILGTFILAAFALAIFGCQSLGPEFKYP